MNVPDGVASTMRAHFDSGWRCGVTHFRADGSRRGQCAQCAVCGEWVAEGHESDECMGTPKLIGVPKCGKCGKHKTRIRFHDFQTDRISYGEWFCVYCAVKSRIGGDPE